MSKARKTTTKAHSASRIGIVSQYDLYRLPFFDGDRRLTWAVKPSGDYGTDCETGRDYARQFLASCDGTVGWSALLGQIVCDIVRMGPEKTRADGSVTSGGIVIGFMGELSRALILGEGFIRAAKRGDIRLA